MAQDGGGWHGSPCDMVDDKKGGSSTLYFRQELMHISSTRAPGH